MEVHHHPNVEKKGFKEYFLEFLMIFLAVTMGFIAENIRENISDNSKVNEYMRSMVSDLKNDVSMYKKNDSINLSYCNMIDSIFTLLKSNSNTGEMYYLARRLTMMGASGPSIDAKTYLQLTSTGSFRLLKHQRIADSIATYYQLIKSFDNWSELQLARVNSIINSNDKLFNAEVLFSIYKAIESDSNALHQIVKSNPSLMSNDPHDINAVAINYQYYYGFMKLMNGRTLMASTKAKQLITLLENEYNIKE